MITRWEALESTIRTELVKAQEKHPLCFHRFYDTKSANTLLPQQPADFQACYLGKVCMLEAKFSQAHESLRNNFAGAVRANQLAAARIWTRAGAKYIVLFHSSLSGITECWDGIYLAECKSRGVKLSLDERRLYDSVELAVRLEIGYA